MVPIAHASDGSVLDVGRKTRTIPSALRRALEGGWRVDWWGTASPVFFDPRGGTHFEGRRKPVVLPEDAVEALERENRAHGAEPDWRTAGARWKRPEDVHADVYFRATEALE